MRHHTCTVIQVVLAYLLMPGPCRAVPQKTRATKTEEVRLGYELVLTKCRGSSCHSVPTLKGNVRLSLEPEDPSFLYDYKAVEDHAGSLQYQLRFEAWHGLKGQAYGRALRIGLSGRIETPFKQLTRAEKLFTGKTWQTLTGMAISGNTYSEGEETITPTLRVTVLKPAKRAARL
jgi:hypothetical protein